ncbi:hypothetical protein IW261DRAFT_1418278 [Armillaria novae-zelandiae]|uniref:Uncharacterized protein n=1 Tax=Armillaria novae-zelandiae TaxID=153914 RepID=A0AA39PFC5_9AGAR|nr:hypothetical protein IW261DRAFT_1418278 [Armillaria novae-zelandiae]
MTSFNPSFRYQKVAGNLKLYYNILHIEIAHQMRKLFGDRSVHDANCSSLHSRSRSVSSITVPEDFLPAAWNVLRHRILYDEGRVDEHWRYQSLDMHSKCSCKYGMRDSSATYASGREARNIMVGRVKIPVNGNCLGYNATNRRIEELNGVVWYRIILLDSTGQYAAGHNSLRLGDNRRSNFCTVRFNHGKHDHLVRPSCLGDIGGELLLPPGSTAGNQRRHPYKGMNA